MKWRKQYGCFEEWYIVECRQHASRYSKIWRTGCPQGIICQCLKNWTNGQWPKRLDTVADHLSSEKCNTRLCQNNGTISLISHPRKVLLRVILSRLVNQAEQILE